MLPRRPSPLGGRRPRRDELLKFAGGTVDDVLPKPDHPLTMLIVGINPGLWTAAVNAPFAHPSNRFWPALFHAGLTPTRLDVTAGMSDAQAESLLGRGIGLTNLVARATARADELTAAELRAGAEALVPCVRRLRPGAVAVIGITAYRIAFRDRSARLGPQPYPEHLDGWPRESALWALPQPSGLNAHHQVEDIARWFRAAWEEASAAAPPGPGKHPGETPTGG